MTVKEMIIELLNCPMDAKIVVEIPTKVYAKKYKEQFKEQNK